MALITTNLKAQFETTNTVVSPTLWVDEVAGIELVQEHLMTAPVLRTGEEGTPTGASYFQFVGSIDGLGNDTLYDHDLPDGAEPRTMYIVARYPNQVNAGNFNGVMYGNPSTRQAFGMVMSGTEKVLTDFWAASYASVDSFNDDLWHVLAVTFDGEDVEGFIDNVNLMGGTPATLNTVLERLYINYKLSNNSGAFMDCAAVLIYAGAHNPAQLAETNAYLRNKYIEEIPSGGGTVVSERAASSGGTSGLNAAPVSVLSRTASNGGTSGATAAPVIVQGRAATSGGTSGADAAATLVSGRAGASGGTSGASASPVRIATRSAPGGGASGSPAAPVQVALRGASSGGASGSEALPQAGTQTSRGATSGGASGSEAMAVRVQTRSASSGGVSGTGAMAVHVSVKAAASGGLSGAEAIPAAVTLRAANAGGVSGLTAEPTLIAARSAVSGGTSGSEAAPADTSRVVDFRATALWDEPRFTALWDEPRFVAEWRD